MMNTIYYQGSDGCVKVLGDNELAHYKYIKKIGNRYFYTTEALQAYYNDQKRVANVEYKIDKAKANKERNDRDKFREKVNRDVKESSVNAVVLYRDKNGKLKSREQTKKEKRATAKEADRRAAREKQMYKVLDAIGDTKMSATRVAKPVAKTAKRAVTPIKTPKDRVNDFLNNRPRPRKVYTKKKKKNTAPLYKPKPGTPASRW